MVSIERVWFAFLFALILIEQCYARTPVIKLGRWPAINYLGKISYGLYCYHGLVLTMAAKILSVYPVTGQIMLKLVIPALLFLFTTLAASVSYAYFEKPFLRLKEKYY